MEELRLSSLQEFEEALESLHREVAAMRTVGRSKMLFRGQANASWRLDTTLERFQPGEVALLAYNRYLVRIHGQIESYTGKRWPIVRDPDVNPEWLLDPPNYELMVYARHHGFPSPLLDWRSESSTNRSICWRISATWTPDPT